MSWPARPALELDALSVGILVVAVNGSFTALNRAARELLGLPDDAAHSQPELPNRSCLIDTNGQLLRERDLPWQVALTTQQPVRGMLVARQAPPGAQWLLVDAIPQAPRPGVRRGEVICTLSAFNGDIANTAAEGPSGSGREKFFRAIIENIPDPVYVREARSLRFVQLNAAAEALLGVEREALMGESQNPALAPTQRCELDRVDRALLQSQHRRQVTEEVVATPAGDRVVRTKRIVIRGEDDHAEYLLCIAEDITERKAAEREHALLQEQLRHSQKMEAIGTLAGGVAHDINNVLGAITGIVSTLRSELVEGTEAAQDLDNVLQACKQGSDLTLDLLGFARKGKLRKERVLITDVIRELIGLLERTISKKITLLTELQPETAAVEGDPTQLHHALMNICLNAVDAMGTTGSLTFRTWNGENPDIGATVYISIRDTGCGMDPQTLAHAFEPFFTTKPDGRGTGLGLSMVYGTVTHHGGSVELHSQLGHGTTVTLCLPAVSAPTRIIPIRAAPGKAVAQCSGTILVVDDEPLIRTSSLRMLRKLGFDVICVENGERAVELFAMQHDSISLVLLDIMMPVMDGGETLWHLLEIDPDVKVILASGYSQDEKARDLLELGARGFIQKPFEIDALSELIRRAIAS